MRSLKLTRIAFHDRPLDERHLWAAAELWRGEFPITGFLKSGVYELRTEIWGLPRHEARAIRAALSSAATGCSVDVDDANPDLLVMRGSWTDLDQPAVMTPWLAPLQSPACAGLFVVLRMRVCAATPDRLHPTHSGNTLALGGAV